MIGTKIALRKTTHESGEYEVCVENNYTYLFNAAEMTMTMTMTTMTREILVPVLVAEMTMTAREIEKRRRTILVNLTESLESILIILMNARNVKYTTNAQLNTIGFKRKCFIRAIVRRIKKKIRKRKRKIQQVGYGGRICSEEGEVMSLFRCLKEWRTNRRRLIK